MLFSRAGPERVHNLLHDAIRDDRHARAHLASPRFAPESTHTDTCVCVCVSVCGVCGARREYLLNTRRPTRKTPLANARARSFSRVAPLPVARCARLALRVAFCAVARGPDDQSFSRLRADQKCLFRRRTRASLRPKNPPTPRVGQFPPASRQQIQLQTVCTLCACVCVCACEREWSVWR